MLTIYFCFGIKIVNSAQLTIEENCFKITNQFFNKKTLEQKSSSAFKNYLLLTGLPNTSLKIIPFKTESLVIFTISSSFDSISNLLLVVS